MASSQTDPGGSRQYLRNETHPDSCLPVRLRVVWPAFATPLSPEIGRPRDPIPCFSEPDLNAPSGPANRLRALISPAAPKEGRHSSRDKSAPFAGAPLAFRPFIALTLHCGWPDLPRRSIGRPSTGHWALATSTSGDENHGKRTWNRN